MVGVVVALRLVVIRAVQAALASSFSNTSPNLITKSSNHQAHGLHLLAYLLLTTLWLRVVEAVVKAVVAQVDLGLVQVFQ